MTPRLSALLPLLALAAWSVPAASAAQDPGGRDARADSALSADPVEAAPHRLVLDLDLRPGPEGQVTLPPIDFDPGDAGMRTRGRLERLLADPLVFSLRTQTVDFVVHDRPVVFQYVTDGRRGPTLRIEVGLLKAPRYDLRQGADPSPRDGRGAASEATPGVVFDRFDVETEVLELHLRGQGRLVSNDADSTVLRVDLTGSGDPAREPRDTSAAGG